MSDAVLKIGAVVDKDAVVSGMAEGAGAVDAATVQMATSFTVLQGKAKAAWAQISSDTREAASSVSSQSLKIAEATRAYAQAQRELQAALRLTRNVNVDAAESSALLAAAQDNLRAKALELAAAQEAVAEKTHASVSGVQATSAAIRSLEGNAGLRAVENFVSKTLNLGPLMQKLFPLIGAAAFGKILFDVGEKVFEVGEKAAHASEAIGEAFGEMHDKALVTNDDLRIQSDKLQEEIDKLSGHPGNGLQLALDEAIKRADQLLVSLRADHKALQDLFKENSVGTFAGLLVGKEGTGTEEKEILKDQTKLQDDLRAANDSYLADLKSQKTPEAVEEASKRHAAAIRESFEKHLRPALAEVARLEKEQSDSAKAASINSAAGIEGFAPNGIDNSAKIANLKGYASQLQDRLTQGDIEETIAGQQAKLGGLKQGKAGQEEEGKAAEARFKAMEAHLAEWKLLAPVTAQAIYAYWDAQRQTFAVGSQQYNAIVEKQAALAEEGARKVHEGIGKIKAEGQKLAQGMTQANLSLLSPAASAMGKQADDDVLQLGPRWEAYRKDLAKGQEAQITLTASLEVGRVKAMESAGALTALGAAQQLGTAHAREHAAMLKILEDDLDRLKAQAKSFNVITGQYSDPKEAAAIKEAQDRLAQQKGKGTQQGQQDQAAISAAVAKPYLTAFDAINSGWLRVQNDLIMGNRNIARDFQRMGAQLVSDAAMWAERWLAKHAQAFIRDVALHHAAEAQKTAATVAGAAASTAAQVSSATAAQATIAPVNVAEVMSLAAVAGAAAFAATAAIPFIGPELAPAAGAAAATQVAGTYGPLAAFEKGTMFVPKQGMAILHPGEAVLGSPSAEVMRDAMSGKLASGGEIHIHMGGHVFNGGASSDVIAALRKQPRQLSQLVARMRREGTL